MPDLNAGDELTINRLSHLSGDHTSADVFTKGLNPEKQWYCSVRPGMVTVPEDAVRLELSPYSRFLF